MLLKEGAEFGLVGCSLQKDRPKATCEHMKSCVIVEPKSKQVLFVQMCGIGDVCASQEVFSVKILPRTQEKGALGKNRLDPGNEGNSDIEKQQKKGKK